ncbi:O-antigen ligase domain-containing protein [Tropicibacter sp. R15_0]|uniref:O-antigen ligase domain-containing protein n=1 Tax=Tropicibacter sp. R15_0 TaxID=2821101 RepID=UPI001ADC7ED7|nr:O-antigen ligase domain-containing protein [Tropicibacter sp. R15_0]MBO9466432.1 O-antigen ligase domain-containing protein [Tropicibacter sp. R15_0]
MIRPENPAETLVFYALIATWPFYLLGALYIVGPVLGWTLGGLAVLSLYLGPAIRADLRATGPVPFMVWAWILGMAVMLIALWVGHMNWAMGIKTTIKSSIGWAKGWALMALFPLAGAVLPVRRAVLVRAMCIVGAVTLALAPIMLIAPFIGLPQHIFTSPLKVVGGPGPEYFSVFLYTIDPGSGAPRWQFFAPWSPFAALLGVIMVLFALEETDKRWMWAGLLAGVLMILTSKSRMGLVGLVFCTSLPRLAPYILRGFAWSVLAGLTTLAGLFAGMLQQVLFNTITAFQTARADSTRVRATLQRIAFERWQQDAIWFGHGRVQPGAHLVEYMPIGSHHTWYGLLFIKGLVGFFAFAIPFALQFLTTLISAIGSPKGALPFGIVLTLFLLSFGENLEIQTYLLWPGLLMLGLHSRETAQPRKTI